MDDKKQELIKEYESNTGRNFQQDVESICEACRNLSNAIVKAFNALKPLINSLYEFYEKHKDELEAKGDNLELPEVNDEKL